MNLKTKILALVAISIVLSTILSVYLNSRSSNELVKVSALKMAEVIANQVVYDRKHYVHGVVNKVKGTPNSPIKAGGYESTGEKVPLPAEFIKLVADDVAKNQDDYRYGIVSLWNINSENNLKNDFLKIGFKDLQHQESEAKKSNDLTNKKAYEDWKPYYSFEKEDGRDVLRFMKADPASGQGCVSCHNMLEVTDKFIALRKDQGLDPKLFELNDLMGAIDVTIDLEEVGGMVQKASSQMILLSILVAIIILLVSFFTIKNLIHPVEKVVYAMEDISQGDADLTKRLKEGSDEVGQLGKAFNEFMKKMQNSIEDINRMSDVIASTSGKISKVSLELSSGTKNTNKEVDQVVDTTKEMLESVDSMASATEEMKTNVSTVSSAAEQMSVNMDSVASAIEEMSTTGKDVAKSSREASDVAADASKMAENASSKMNLLDQASEEIGKVTDVIKRIAEQTNLLALNATIEAASAGEAGKGFAVVAGEIKELANQSAKAAEDIASKIEGVQSNTKEAVSVIGEVTKIISNIDKSVVMITKVVGQQDLATSEIAKNAAESNQGAKNIAKSIAEVGKGTSDLSKNANEVSKGTIAVSSSIDNVSQVAKMGEENAVAVSYIVDDLLKISVEMGVFVDSFKISDSDSSDYFQWRDAFTVEVPVFDEEHKNILKHINDLNRARHSNAERSEITSILGSLVQTTVDHFAHEEKVFAEFGYEGDKEQKEEHTGLLKDVTEFIDSYRSGEREVDEDFMKFLKNWLIEHILKMDRQYASFFSNKNIT
jgi:hemerythrin-like metal-binding protein